LNRLILRCAIRCRSSISTPTKRISAFLLSILSPVLQKRVCGDFRENAVRRVELEDVDPASFQRVLDLWCGRDDVEFESVRQVLKTAAIAERFQVAEVVAALEDALIKQLRMENCAEVLEGSAVLGLGRAEAAAEGLALEQFGEMARTVGFLGLGEEAIGRLLDADRLQVGSEERLLEGVVRWMAARGEGAAREGAVRADGGGVPAVRGGEAGASGAPRVGEGGGAGGAAGEAVPGRAARAGAVGAPRAQGGDAADWGDAAECVFRRLIYPRSTPVWYLRC
jgi:hypothetical protein